MKNQELPEDEASSTRDDIELGDVAPPQLQGGDNPQGGQGGSGYLAEDGSFVMINWGAPSEGEEETPQEPLIGDRIFQFMFRLTVGVSVAGIILGVRAIYFSGEENLQTDLSGESEAFSSSADIIG